MKAKLKGNYPPKPGNDSSIKNVFDIKDVNKASLWSSKCLCQIKFKKLMLENRAIQNIIIECKICDNKRYIGTD